ncbi:hypothetical protein GCM10020367_42090 [Streptomyces sannanensis]|uniref:Uncharacterized protein n=1 Tax=Streptomyces sannanensis TaxID=285536 RepID=A0ABP6SEZ6_9ACTN
MAYSFAEGPSVRRGAARNTGVDTAQSAVTAFATDTGEAMRGALPSCEMPWAVSGLGSLEAQGALVMRGRAGGTARSTSIHRSPTSSGRSPVGDVLSPEPEVPPGYFWEVSDGVLPRPVAEPISRLKAKPLLCPFVKPSMLTPWEKFLLWSMPGCVRHWASPTRAPR